jgi:hypothetical protein
VTALEYVLRSMVVRFGPQITGVFRSPNFLRNSLCKKKNLRHVRNAGTCMKYKMQMKLKTNHTVWIYFARRSFEPS